MYNSNGPPKGFNVTSDQSSYDMVIRDIIVCSTLGLPNYDYSNFSFDLKTDNINQIYKAELVSATVKFNDSSGINGNVINKTLILSIPQLNQNTFYVAGKNAQTQSQIFCQIPDNCTPLRLGSLTTNNTLSLFIGARMFDTVQYYNPPINKINSIDIQWFAPNGTVIKADDTPGNISTYYFTLRIYYFQKRNNVSQFSTGVVTTTGTGTLGTIFEPYQR